MTTDKPDLAEAEARIAANTRRALVFWAARWSIGLAGAVAIVLYTGQHHWVIAAALAIAGVSLGIVFLNASGQRRRIAHLARTQEDEAR